jgi:hypothetical protein
VRPAGGGLLYWKMHNRARLQGCVGGDGDTLVNEKDNRTYKLTSNQETLKPGQRVELKGKKIKNDSGELGFEVHKITKDLGHVQQQQLKTDDSSKQEGRP